MSSWYSAFESATEALNKIGDTIADELPSFEAASEALNKIPTLDTASEALSGISTKALNNEFVSKLTLRSDELVREHELLDAQEKRKELVREYLSEILPWETKDESKEILVEQCKEAILNLSRDKASFETPFALENGQMFNPDNYTEVTFENSSDEADTEEGNDNEHNKDVGDSTIEMTPEQKLEKMLPLPLLLEHFDIDTHVGLIERLLKVDEDLVYMHSMLSGAGEKERLFWKNYFFHCAFIRYQKGLSLEEIWSSKPKAIITGNTEINSSGMNTNERNMTDIIDNIDDDDSVELDFEEENLNVENDGAVTRNNSNNETSQSFPDVTAALTKSKSNDGSGIGEENSTVANERTQSDSVSEYEIVNDAIGNINDGDDGDDLDDMDDMDDMDDLEAEIARELGEE